MHGSVRKPIVAGFTLMELMVVVAIVTVMIVIAIPNFGTFMANMRLKSAADDLYFTLQQTRMNAIRGGGRWMVVFSNTSYQVVNCVDNDCGTTENNVVVKETLYSTYKGISFSDTFDNHLFKFTPDGMAAPYIDDDPRLEIGKVTLSSAPNKSKFISICKTGIIRMNYSCEESR